MEVRSKQFSIKKDAVYIISTDNLFYYHLGYRNADDNYQCLLGYLSSKNLMIPTERIPFLNIRYIGKGRFQEIETGKILSIAHDIDDKEKERLEDKEQIETLKDVYTNYSNIQPILSDIYASPLLISIQDILDGNIIYDKDRKDILADYVEMIESEARKMFYESLVSHVEEDWKCANAENQLRKKA